MSQTFMSLTNERPELSPLTNQGPVVIIQVDAPLARVPIYQDISVSRRYKVLQSVQTPIN